MKLRVTDGQIITSGGHIEASHQVLDAVEIGGKVYVIYDYMEFPRGEPARNLFAYDMSGTEIWRASDIGQGAVDAYTNFIALNPLTVANFSSFNCTIDESTGRVISTKFTK